MDEINLIDLFLGQMYVGDDRCVQLSIALSLSSDALREVKTPIRLDRQFSFSLDQAGDFHLLDFIDAHLNNIFSLL